MALSHALLCPSCVFEWQVLVFPYYWGETWSPVWCLLMVTWPAGTNKQEVWVLRNPGLLIPLLDPFIYMTASVTERTASSVTVREELKSPILYVEKNLGLFIPASHSLWPLTFKSPHPKDSLWLGSCLEGCSWRCVQCDWDSVRALSGCARFPLRKLCWDLAFNSQRALVLVPPHITTEAPASDFLMCIFQIPKSVGF